MTKTLEFLFDFGSPNCYLAYKALPSYTEKLDAAVEIVPCLLGGVFKATGNRSPVETSAGVKGKIEYELLEIRRFCARHAISKFAFHPYFPINTLTLMRGLVAVEDRRERYIDAVLGAMWEDGRNMNDTAIVAQVLTAAGFDPGALMAQTQDPGVKRQLIDNTEAAVARGVFGLPAFFVGGEMFFGKDRLRDAAELLQNA